MESLRRRILATLIAIVGICAASPGALISLARGDDLAGFHADLNAARQHSLAARKYLRTDDRLQAVSEISRLRESFSALIDRHGAARRAAHKNETDYTTAMVDIPLRMVTAQIMIDSGRPDLAANAIRAICHSLSALHDPPESTAACDQD